MPVCVCISCEIKSISIIDYKQNRFFLFNRLCENQFYVLMNELKSNFKIVCFV